MMTIQRILSLAALWALSIQLVSAQETENLSQRWARTKIDVAKAAVSGGGTYFNSNVRGFKSEALNVRSRRSRIISGSVANGDDLAGCESFHIYGDLNADLHLEQHGSAIIAGSVSPTSTITLDGLNSLYIGGDFAGTINAVSTFHLVNRGDFLGSIKVSEGMGLRIDVGGDFDGSIELSEDTLHSATISVSGYTSWAKISELYRLRFISLGGYFQQSEQAPGIYNAGRRGVQWYAVQEQRQGPQPARNAAPILIDELGDEDTLLGRLKLLWRSL